MWQGIAAAAAPIIGGLFGNSAAEEDAKRARELQKAALEIMNGVRVPTVEEQKVFYEMLQSQGKLTPEMEQTFQQADSEMKKVKSDPRLRDAQLNALLKLQEIGNEQGLDPESRAQLERVKSEVATQERGNREAIMQNMAQRGVSGSGMELAAQLQSSQGAANRSSLASFDIAAEARKRALEAIMQSGNLSGNIRSQDFGEQSEVAQAQDAINKFNTANRQDVTGRNTNRTNEAQAGNLAERQRIADSNVAARNEQEQHNKSLAQQKFDNDYRKAAGAAGQYESAADRDAAEADRKRKMWTGIGQGVGQGVAAYGKK